MAEITYLYVFSLNFINGEVVFIKCIRMCKKNNMAARFGDEVQIFEFK